MRTLKVAQQKKRKKERENRTEIENKCVKLCSPMLADHLKRFQETDVLQGAGHFKAVFN